MTITFFLHIVKYAQNGLSVKETLIEEIAYILHPELFYYPDDYPNSFPKNYL